MTKEKKGAHVASKAQGAKKAGKADVTNITRKSATFDLVVDTAECADLELYTKETEIQLGQTRRGKLLKRGKYDYKFVENGIPEQQNGRPWEVRVKLAEEKPYARISANSNGGFLSVYVPKENFRSTRELAEIFLDQTELLCEKLDGVDAIAIIEKLDALKQELLEVA